MSQMSLPLSECAGKYATAIADPWAPEAEGACVPTFPSRPSQKVTAFGRFTVTIGTGGFGFVVFAPSLASDGYTGYFSTGTFAGTSCSTSTGVTGVSRFQMSNIPVSINDFVESIPESGNSLTGGRIVSFGASAEYTGTELNRGGLIYALVEPGHESIHGFTTADMGSYREVSIQRVTEKKVWISTFGQSAQEVQYPDDFANLSTNVDRIRKVYPYSRGQQSDYAADVGSPIMGFIFTGTSQNTFEVECVLHAELIGYKSQTMLTPSHSDSRGFEVVQQAAGNLNNARSARPGTSLKTLLFDGIREVSGMLKAGESTIRGMAPKVVMAAKSGADPRAIAMAVAATLARDKGVRQQIGHSLNRIGKKKKGRR